MESKLLKNSELLKDVGRHYISEENIWVQVIEVTRGSKNTSQFYDKHKGELLIISLKGSGSVITPEMAIDFNEKDQVFLNNGTPFRIESDDLAVVELIWTPGLSKEEFK